MNSLSERLEIRLSPSTLQRLRQESEGRGVNVPMYAAGKLHPLKEPCQRVVLAVAKGELNAVTDTEV